MSVRQSIGHDVTEYTRHTEYGVVKIFYHIDITKTMAVVSGIFIVPALFYAGDKLLNDGELCTHEATHYFDASSGQEISYSDAQENKNKNEQADLLDREGNELHNQGKYQEAYEKFSQAYTKCTSGYSSEARFKRNRDIAKDNWAKDLNKQANQLYEQNHYSEAAQKYHEAYSTCTSESKDLQKSYLSNEANCYRMLNNYSKAIELFDQALQIDNNYEYAKNNQAETFNSWGNSLFKQGKYVEASEKYNQAYQRCTGNYSSEQTFKDNMNYAKAEICNAEGDRLYSQQKYGEALAQYQAAQIQCPTKKTEALNKYRNNEANSLNNQGFELLSNGDFAGASNKFDSAYQKCSSGYRSKQIFGDNMNYAKAEVLNAEGTILHNQKKYAEAITQYQAAQRQCPANKTEALNKYKNNEAYSLSSQALDLWNDGDYTGAANKFHAAYSKCSSNCSSKNIFRDNMNHAEAEALNLEGDKLHSQKKYTEAVAKYHAASSKCPSSKTDDINKYKNNEAFSLYNQGLELWNNGDFAGAAKKFDVACLTCSSEYSKKARFETERDKAKNEVNALNFYQSGEKLFSEFNYSDALKKYQAAYSISKEVEAKSIYKNGIVKAQAEVNANQLYEEGEVLYVAGNYMDAEIKYTEAIHASNINKDYYKIYVNKAQAEINAEIFNNEGNVLFESGDFVGAKDKYQQAYDISEVAKKTDNFYSRLFYGPHEYKSNIVKTETEIYAVELSKQASILFNKGKFVEAIMKYQEAYKKTQLFTQRKLYQHNSEIIQSKVCNKVGYKLLNEASTEGDRNVKIMRYKNAQEKFEKAISLCPSNDIYKSNLTKVLNTIDAINLNTQGDQLVEQEKYESALAKYQAAHDKSGITKEKNMYAANIDKMQTIISKLSTLEDLWKNAWDAENDEENDRSEEANEDFRKVSIEAKECLKLFPASLKFKQYETLVILKIEGNDLFNKGIESQQKGIRLLQEAKELKHQQKYELANVKYQEAKDNFYAAQKKFEKGNEKDQRFLSCIQQAKEHIQESIRSIEIIDQHITQNQAFSNLDIKIISNNSHNDRIIDQNHNYEQHILY